MTVSDLVGSFDGTNDYVSYGSVGIADGAAKLTVSFWLYWVSADAGVAFAEGVRSTNGWHCEITAGGNLQFIVPTGGIGTYAQTVATAVTTGAWHHWAIVYDAGTVVFYRDGAVVSLGTSGGTLPAVVGNATTNPLRINDGSGGSLSLYGQLAELAVWPGTAATLAQVGEIYGSALHPPNLADLATMPVPSFWAPLDGTWDPLIGSAVGSASGGPTFVSSSLIRTDRSVYEGQPASTSPASAHGLAPAFVTPHGLSPASVVSTGVPVVADWCSTGSGWLLSQFRYQPRMEAFLCALLDRAQDLEQALADLRDLRSLNEARGVVLDVVGWAMGLPRSECPDPNISDDAYRNALRGLAAAKSSNGSPDAMMRVALQLLGGAAGITYTESYPAEVVIACSSRLTYNEGKLFARIIRRAKPACVSFAFKYFPAEPAGVGILVYDDDPVLPHLSIPEDGATSPLDPEEDSGV